MSDQLGEVVHERNIFLVFLKDGTKKYVVALSEQDLPFDLEQIAFAASLAEIEVCVSEMKQLMSSDIVEGSQ